jgi:3-dehydroquinate synthetase
LPIDPAAILEALGRDKKHAGGELRWVLPTATGSEVRSGVPDAVVQAVLGELIRGPTGAVAHG